MWIAGFPPRDGLLVPGPEAAVVPMFCVVVEVPEEAVGVAVVSVVAVVGEE